MLWMLLVYVVAANGYAGAPAITSGAHGATFATREECDEAARKVTSYAAPGTDDIARSGLIMVCAPVLPPEPPPPPPAPATVVIPPPQPAFPAYPAFPPPPPMPAKHPRH